MSSIFQRPISPIPLAVKRKRQESQIVARNAAKSSDEQDAEIDDTPKDFPHACVPSSDALHPAGYTQRHVKSRHVDILNAILHKSLLSHDWERASRAFGLLLRSSLSGVRMDLRAKNHWGIGAEILLRGNLDASTVPVSDQSPQCSTELDEQWFTAEGFERAKAYYMRLILQYPKPRAHHHQNSRLAYADTFHPVMVRLWIMHVQLQRKRAELHMAQMLSNAALTSDSSREEAIVRGQLADAKDIAQYLQDTIQSLPIRDQDLLDLSDMVDKWIVDLEVEHSLFSSDINARRRRFEQNAASLPMSGNNEKI